MTSVSITRLSSRGQIVLPTSLRETLGLKVGEVFALFGENDTVILKRVDIPSKKEFESLMEWGESFAQKKGVSRDKVLSAIQDVRKAGA